MSFFLFKFCSKSLKKSWSLLNEHPNSHHHLQFSTFSQLTPGIQSTWKYNIKHGSKGKALSEMWVRYISSDRSSLVLSWFAEKYMGICLIKICRGKKRYMCIHTFNQGKYMGICSIRICIRKIYTDMINEDFQNVQNVWGYVQSGFVEGICSIS